MGKVTVNQHVHFVDSNQAIYKHNCDAITFWGFECEADIV